MPFYYGGCEGKDKIQCVQMPCSSFKQTKNVVFTLNVVVFDSLVCLKCLTFI